MGAGVAGVVDEDVDRAEGRLRRRHTGAHTGEIGDVEHGGRRPPAGLHDRRCARLGPLGHEIVDRDRGPLGGEVAGDARADVLSGAGDERHPAGEIEEAGHPRDDSLGP